MLLIKKLRQEAKTKPKFRQKELNISLTWIIFIFNLRSIFEEHNQESFNTNKKENSGGKLYLFLDKLGMKNQRGTLNN